MSTRERSTLIRRVVDEAVGLGVLEPLLADESISEIMINGHQTVYIERFGRVERIPSGFTTEAQLLQVATLRPWLGGTRPRLRASATIEAPAGALAAWGVRVGSRLAYEATAFVG